MAQRVITELIDDLDGKSEAVESFAFTIEGKSYEIDLSEKNAAKFRKALAPFVEHARRAPKVKRQGAGRSGGR